MIIDGKKYEIKVTVEKSKIVVFLVHLLSKS